MLLRPGNAGSNTVADHLRVLADAIAQLPIGYRRKIMVRVDGAGATHDLLDHLEQMNRLWRSVKFTVGWTITEPDETAIAALPETAWTDSLDQDGTVTNQAQVAELTGLSTRLDGWPGGLRLILRRTRPSARHAKKLTALQRATGWRYAIVATNISRLHALAGSHQPQWLDALHRSHAGVEEGFQTAKGQVGLDQHQVRQWHSWHRFTTLALAALAILTICAADTSRRADHTQPDATRMSVNEIRRLINILILHPTGSTTHRLRWSDWRLQHQARAKRAHYAHRLSIEFQP